MKALGRLAAVRLPPIGEQGVGVLAQVAVGVERVAHQQRQVTARALGHLAEDLPLQVAVERLGLGLRRDQPIVPPRGLGQGLGVGLVAEALKRGVEVIEVLRLVRGRGVTFRDGVQRHRADERLLILQKGILLRLASQLRAEFRQGQGQEAQTLTRLHGEGRLLHGEGRLLRLALGLRRAEALCEPGHGGGQSSRSASAKVCRAASSPCTRTIMAWAKSLKRPGPSAVMRLPSTTAFSRR